MDEMKEIKECLLEHIQEYMSDMDKVDYHELGAAIDMVKDISQAMYYCTTVKAMQNGTFPTITTIEEEPEITTKMATK